MDCGGTASSRFPDLVSGVVLPFDRFFFCGVAREVRAGETPALHGLWRDRVLAVP
jgi:hypothetical protein